METDLHMLLAKRRVAVDLPFWFICLSLQLPPWTLVVSEFPGHPWAAMSHGIALSSTEMLLLEYRKGL